MELEEAIRRVENLEVYSCDDGEAIEMVVQELENSIPKKKIEDNILELHETIALENNSMYGYGNEEYIKELGFKINALQELLEDK